MSERRGVPAAAEASAAALRGGRPRGVADQLWKRLRAAAPAPASSSLSWGFLSRDRARPESKRRSFIVTQGSKYG